MVKLLKPLSKSLDLFGTLMQKTSMKFQFESALAAYGLIWFSLIFMFGFQIVSMFMDFSWWQVFYALNAGCGILIIYSMLVSTYMSYLQIKVVEEAQKLMDIPQNSKGGKNNGK